MRPYSAPSTSTYKHCKVGEAIVMCDGWTGMSTDKDKTSLWFVLTLNNKMLYRHSISMGNFQGHKVGNVWEQKSSKNICQ